ncbi:MAG: membrane dipeptidase [Pseudomonadota bacterium]
MPRELLIQASRVLEESLVWDNHSCMPLRPDDASFLPQLEEVRNAGVDVVTLNVGMDMTSPDSHFEMLDSFHSWLSARSSDYRLVLDVDDIAAAKSSSALAVAFDVEGMGLLDDGDLSRIEALRSRGVLWMLVAYNRNNRAGGGCLDDDIGLTKHGQNILREMRRVGMIVCCSHSGHETAAQVIAEADNPVIFSHSNPNGAHEHVRNIPDTLIRACAGTGGVVGINGVGDFLGEGEDYTELLVRHIDYVVSLVGPEHVGIALDYVFDKQEVYDFIEKAKSSFGEEMASQFSARFAPPSTLLPVTAKLLEIGYSASDLKQILGENWLRVAETVAERSDMS